MSDQEVRARDSPAPVSSQEDDSVDINDGFSKLEHHAEKSSSVETSKADSASLKPNTQPRKSQRLMGKKEAENSKQEEQGITELNHKTLAPCWRPVVLLQ